MLTGAPRRLPHWLPTPQRHSTTDPPDHILDASWGAVGQLLRLLDPRIGMTRSTGAQRAHTASPEEEEQQQQDTHRVFLCIPVGSLRARGLEEVVGEMARVLLLVLGALLATQALGASVPRLDQASLLALAQVSGSAEGETWCSCGPCQRKAMMRLRGTCTRRAGPARARLQALDRAARPQLRLGGGERCGPARFCGGGAWGGNPGPRSSKREGALRGPCARACRRLATASACGSAPWSTSLRTPRRAPP